MEQMGFKAILVFAYKNIIWLFFCNCSKIQVDSLFKTADMVCYSFRIDFILYWLKKKVADDCLMPMVYI